MLNLYKYFQFLLITFEAPSNLKYLNSSVLDYLLLLVTSVVVFISSHFIKLPFSVSFLSLCDCSVGGQPNVGVLNSVPFSLVFEEIVPLEKSVAVLYVGKFCLIEVVCLSFKKE